LLGATQHKNAKKQQKGGTENISYKLSSSGMSEEVHGVYTLKLRNHVGPGKAPCTLKNRRTGGKDCPQEANETITKRRITRYDNKYHQDEGTNKA